MTPTNRRNILLGSAAVAAGMSVGGMSGCPTSTGGIDPAVIDKINQIIAGSCNAVGMAATIVAMAAAMFPGIGAAALTIEQLGQIAQAFCHAIQNPPQAGKYAAKLGSTEVDVHGWVVKDSKVTQF